MTMPHKAINKLGELERAVMDTVWQAGRGPLAGVGRDVHDELSRSAATSPTRRS